MRENRPTLIYDGGCKFCVQQLKNIQRLVGNCFDAHSFREESTLENFPELSYEACEKSIQFIDSEGKIYEGAEAFFRVLSLRTHLKPFLWVYYVPGIRFCLEWLYAKISLHRHRIDLWFK